jgi:hypothetical protein
VPAYLKDMFGTRYVGAIHGLLLTAWSMAGIFGPVLVNYIREYNITHGVPKAQAYNVTMYIMAGLLVIGFLCNLLVKAVHHGFHMGPEDDGAFGDGGESQSGGGGVNHGQVGRRIKERPMTDANQNATPVWHVLAWGFVGIPLA